MNNKFFKILGWVATLTAVLMYISYIPQISGNVAGINCTLWVLYGFLGEERDWPIIIANSPGIIFGFTAAFTAL